MKNNCYFSCPFMLCSSCHRKLFEIPIWELNGKFSHSWEIIGTRNYFLGKILGFYWERTSTFLLHPNVGNMLWMSSQVIPKAGNNMGTVPKLFPILWIMGEHFPKLSPELWLIWEHLSKLFPELWIIWTKFPSYSQLWEWYRNLYPSYSHNCD